MPSATRLLEYSLLIILPCSVGAAIGCGVDERDPSLADDRVSPDAGSGEPQGADVAAGPLDAPPGAAAAGADTASDGASADANAPAPPSATPPSDVLVTIEAAGSGRFGRVISLEPSPIVCDIPPCRYSLPRGTSITLRAQTGNVGSGFAGWVHDRCMGQGDCPLTLGEDVSIRASYEPANVAFVTSTSVSGDFGGPEQADAICNARAAERGLDGPFRAWMSSTSSDAIDALQGARGWVRLDNYPVVDTVDALVQARMFYPIQSDERGMTQNGRVVWTGTSGNSGRLSVMHCNDWSSAAADVMGGSGRTTLVGMNFSLRGFSSCDTPGGIYCFGVGKNVTISPIPNAGRLAFLTDQFFTIGGGIAGADALCQGRAEASGRTGRYKALLATSSASAAARFDLTDTRTIVRADGMLVSIGARAFFEGTNWLTGINVAPSRAYITNYPIWSGSASLTQPGTLESTCNDWTAADAQGRVGFSTFTTPAEFFGDSGLFYSCGTSSYIGCLEE
ncbi:MAG TPA: hypothetical protein VMG12_37520 [Polyangiaceae bacterium]|nr:hypothetical protein [Polyangiaceae bacterium]